MRAALLAEAKPRLSWCGDLRPDPPCAGHGPAPGGRDPGPSDLSVRHRPRAADHPNRGTIQVPALLGDAVQWKRETRDLFTGGHLVIETDDQKSFFSESELKFPEELLGEAGAIQRNR